MSSHNGTPYKPRIVDKDFRSSLQEPHGLTDGQLLAAFGLCLVVLAGLLTSVYVGGW